MQHDHLLDTAPIFLLAVDHNLQIIYRSSVADATLGPDAGRNLREIMDIASVASLEELQQDISPGDAPVRLLATFSGRNGALHKIAGLVDRASSPDGTTLLRFTACHDVHCGQWLEQLILSEEVLRGFVQTSSEAMWCIEFSEPVDITQSDHEIIRQVFENDCHWLLCNEALAQLYQLPPGLDINLQPVSLYFPRSPENEAFIRQIIHADFSVDHAPSTDFRYDGAPLYMENNVRCSIIDGQLVRIIGTLRDVTDYRRAQNRLQGEVDAVRNILSALPDAILVIDRNRRLVAVNPSFETLFGWSSEIFLGRDVQSIIDLEQPLPGGRQWYGFDPLRWQTTVKTKSAAPLSCEAQIAPIGEDDNNHFVLSLRPSHSHAIGERQ
jgi:PAS domain-containing protein